MTVRAGVIGRPIAHSLSPPIHRAWIAAAGLDAAYDAYEASADGFAARVRELREEGLRGLNVTLPFKAEALALADEADAAARAAGAANLLLFKADGRVRARNTDGLGLVEALNLQAPMWLAEPGPVLVLGAGGAARGAAAALQRPEVTELRIANRTLAGAEALADAFGGRACDLVLASKAAEGARLVVNATSSGLGGDGPPLRLRWPRAPAGAAAMDMTYRPLFTDFLKGARTEGWAPVDGLAMLVGQAAPSFEAFYGRPPPPGPDVRAVCLRELEGRR